MLHDYFTRGTDKTKTGSMVGMEVETDFVFENGKPITTEVAGKLLQETKLRPTGVRQSLELGRQKIEIAISPQPNPALALEAMQEGLDWLYRQAAQFGARPLFEPEIHSDDELLWVQEERDAIWVNLDGREALEQLCRCSSVQFTVDVHPENAIAILNRLHAARLQEVDYAPNHRRWLNYINLSRANYRPDRYGGPEWFSDLDDYVAKLEIHEVVMHKGQPICGQASQVPDLDIDLYLRSIWWHYRLRRYGGSLAVEIRPFSRREDETFGKLWQLIANAIGL